VIRRALRNAVEYPPCERIFHPEFMAFRESDHANPMSLDDTCSRQRTPRRCDSTTHRLRQPPRLKTRAHGVPRGSSAQLRGVRSGLGDTIFSTPTYSLHISPRDMSNEYFLPLCFS
jgi:hypothetical protein